ncbi:MAG: NUDIX hydrolase [Verrucomicrobiota bacterium]
MEKPEHKPWETLDTRTVYDGLPWLAIRKQKVRLQTGAVVDDFHQVWMPDYSLVFAETPEGRVILERHYKHGVGRVNLTFPGGTIDEGETPLQAAQRELLEETGYQAEQWESIGQFTVHANYGCGKVNFFQAKNAQRVAAPDSADLEITEVVLLTREEIREALRDGGIATIDTALFALLAK